MNIFDLLESPGMGHPRDTKGVQSAADQSAASVIGSGTTKREDKKKPVTMMGANVKESVEEAVVTPNFKMPPESLQDKMYRQHQELRKQRGAPSAEEYKERIAQKQKEIDDLKEGILDRAVPKMPKPRNPANAVLGNKVNAAGKHLDKKRRQELAPKHKHQDPLAESLRPGERHHFETDPVTGKRVYKGIRGDQQDAPQRAKDDPAARADQERKAHIAHDRGLTEQAVDDGLQLAFQGYKIKFTPSQLIISKGADIALTRPGDFSNPTKQQISTAKKFVDMLWQKDKTSNQVPNIEHQHELYGLKKEYEEVKSAMEQFLKPFYKERSDLVNATRNAPDHSAWLTGLKVLHDKYYNNPEYKDLEAKSQSIRARLNVLNKGSSWKDKKQDVAESQAVKITDYDTWSDEVKELGGEIHTQRDRNLLVAQSWDGEEIGKFHLGKSMGFINRSGDLDETIRKMGSQYRLLSKKGKNLGTFDTKAGAEKHEREVQYFKHKNMEEGSEDSQEQHVAAMLNRRSRGPQIATHRTLFDLSDEHNSLPAGSTVRHVEGSKKLYVHLVDGSPKNIYRIDKNHVEPLDRTDELAEDIESHLYLMSRAGYDIVQEEWSDKYKDSINCSNPKGFSQKAHCASRKKNEDVAEEKVRLDPKCWTGKKIGNPKTKMKGGVRVNNCVPK